MLKLAKYLIKCTMAQSSLIDTSQLLGGKQAMSYTHYKYLPFKIRRHKWSIIKIIVLLIILIYAILFIQHYRLSKIDLTYDNITSETGGVSMQASPNPYGSIGEIFARPLRVFPVNGIGRGFKMNPINIETRKKKLDRDIKYLMPVVEGWGEKGQAIELKSHSELEKARKQFHLGGYNVYISDRISPNRSLEVYLPKECQDIHYDVKTLPTVSVIIIYTDEIFSALIRTIWSVIMRTPGRLLREIILVDDYSTRKYLGSTLSDYIDIYLNTYPRIDAYKSDKLVKLIRLPERRGLIKARLEGAKMAVGDVLMFLDSHCEVTQRWIEPLLHRIQENPTSFICPVIDIINDKNLEYNAVHAYRFQLGGFDWTGHFTWIDRSFESIKDHPELPVKSPTMAGGLFAVDRKVFFRMGAYDEEMQIWGGENLEMSFRVWQCGGRVEIHPCSRVGHIFRDYHPYSFNGIDSHGINTLRTVLVWMDEYSKYFFMSRPDLAHVDAGNLTSRQELRKKLQCKPFKWYLENVYDNTKFIYDQNVTAYGWIKNNETQLCIDTLNRKEDKQEKAGLFYCEPMEHPLKSLTNQLFSLTKDGQIRRETGCLTVDISDKQELDKKNNYVQLTECLSDSKSYLPGFEAQHWKLKEIDQGKNLIVSRSSEKCITVLKEEKLITKECNEDDPLQHWNFQVVPNEE